MSLIPLLFLLKLMALAAVYSIFPPQGREDMTEFTTEAAE